MAKVSIIVPVYNVEKYIEKCILSLINQTFSDIDILIVNDGSKDNSETIIKKFLYDKRIKYYYKENGGYGSVLEFTINEIESKYFLICDPDDWLDVNAVKTLYEKAIYSDADIVVGCKNLVYNGSDDCVYDDSRFDECEIIKENTVYSKNGELYKFAFLHPSPHSKLYKTDICKNICFPKKVSYTDYLLYLVALSKADRVVYIKDSLSYYLLDRPGNSMTCTKDKVFHDHLLVLKNILPQIDKSSDFIMARVFHQFRNVVLFMNSHGTEKVKSELSNEYLDYLNILKEYRSAILKYYPNTGFKSKIFNYCLLSKYDCIRELFFRRLLYGDKYS